METEQMSSPSYDRLYDWRFAIDDYGGAIGHRALPAAGKVGPQRAASSFGQVLRTQ